MPKSDLASKLPQAARLSHYLRRLFDAHPHLAQEVAATLDSRFDVEAMRAWLQREPLSAANLKPRLRRLRTRVFAHIAARDLCGLAELEEVTGDMSALAELCVEVAEALLHAELAERHGEPHCAASDPQYLICLGMGKLGGGELNVSSDVDFIFVYPEDGETRAGPGQRSISNFEFFTRLGRRLIDALADVTADGYVFRVDMRLRPNGDSGPLVASFDMLENYFIAQGREWERYAWIKARPLAPRGAVAPLAELEKIRRSFVFRKYLDFGAVNAMRELHAQIRREVARRDMADNVKLGPGGIREIEFLAQVFQLIRGGREIVLQVRPTLQVLARLAERGMLEAGAVHELTAAYRFLRKLEHRLQYLNDAQTHLLPTGAEDRAIVAEAMGFSGFDALLVELDDHRANVSRHFEAVFADPRRGGHELKAVWEGAADLDVTCRALARLGYQDCKAAANRLASLRASGRYQQMPAPIRARLDAIVPQTMEVAAACSNPDQTLARMLDLFETIARRGAYLAMLQQYPLALQRVCELVSGSSWAAQYLTRHPILLDELLDSRLLDELPDVRQFRDGLSRTLLDNESDQERQMDVMREQHHAQVFRLLAMDLAGLLSMEKLSDHLTELADVVLDLSLQQCWQKLRARHRHAPMFAVIGYGKLGGKELGYASDLDLVFLYDDEAPQAQETYVRLGQRILVWLSSRTAAGQLFETDTRLRPNGESGLLVSSMDAFEKYQAESAWVWEHQALTRARFCAGDAALGARFETVRSKVLRQRRDPARLRTEVLAMRAKMSDARAHDSPLFDVKHDRDGLIDVEFAVQYLVLCHAAQHAELTGNIGNIALLQLAGALGLIAAEVGAASADAYRTYRRLQHNLRMNGADKARVDPNAVVQERARVRALWQAVFGADE
ncbi:MAG: bifunctional [glutamate--ammonia ligase]-adenylyl-L-tyrosine phosphorylase/[glutamate--ammonia-ligase] adenylyltransferase [Rhodocyclaceae bacterium]|nr:bifunctional [glutamate--ammonia ligase]-adenylyl-L-tyrosine phosphorylase/[glutamate--ammonia-ligase] adenylyltransferase [Rhodocyclaceae bacterium]MBX3669962.1 bifunctional [glutamate--ammonia ligase]-adenylyl-L-tyrosine phosphorylase/[glutamate--ammonia-ligase] adenylyltransferase [Rhodocyclaceae bacterium]